MCEKQVWTEEAEAPTTAVQVFIVQKLDKLDMLGNSFPKRKKAWSQTVIGLGSGMQQLVQEKKATKQETELKACTQICYIALPSHSLLRNSIKFL